MANVADNTLSVIDEATDAVVGTLDVGNGPDAIDIDPVTHLVYVANTLDNTVSVLSGLTDMVTGTLAVGSGPDAVGVDSVTHTLYVANSGDDTVAFDAVAALLPVGAAPTPVPGVTATPDVNAPAPLAPEVASVVGAPLLSGITDTLNGGEATPASSSPNAVITSLTHLRL